MSAFEYPSWCYLGKGGELYAALAEVPSGEQLYIRGVQQPGVATAAALIDFLVANQVCLGGSEIFRDAS